MWLPLGLLIYSYFSALVTIQISRKKALKYGKIGIEHCNATELWYNKHAVAKFISPEDSEKNKAHTV